MEWSSIVSGVERMITLGLMAALVGLTWRLANATRQLAEESKHTRKESRLTRLQSGYIEGIAPFIGSYAEPGQLEYTRDHGPILRDDEKAGRYLQGEGGRLDVNWYGVTFWHPDIGYFVGGAVYIEEDALTWSISAQTYGTGTEQKMSPAILELRNKVRDWESRSAISLGIKTVNGRPVDERELWEITVKTMETRKTYTFIRWNTLSWKRSETSRSRILGDGT